MNNKILRRNSKIYHWEKDKNLFNLTKMINKYNLDSLKMSM